MNLIDWILNLAGLFLWIDWRSGRVVRQPLPTFSLASTVRPTERRKGSGYGSLVALVLLLLLRPWIYHALGARVNWTPDLDLFAISLPWRSDLLDRMYVYSTVSFFLTFGFFYAAMFLLSVVNQDLPEEDVMQRFVRLQLGWLDRIPWGLKLLVPVVIAGMAWAGGAPLLHQMEILPTAPSSRGLWGGALAFGLASLLAWKWVFIVFFSLHWLNIYVYLGTHPVWPYISETSRRLLKPLSFLNFTKLDMAPAAGIILTFVIAEALVKPAVVHLFLWGTG